ncbi:MAG: winged helix-turn-helix domain-containing protein [Rhodoluna sp.]
MTHKILLVEDDHDLSDMLAAFLASKGFEVATCADGSEAVHLFKEFAPSLVLMDIQLPGRDVPLLGVELVREIRDFSVVPIIMVTARSEAEVMELAFAAGADDYFEKSPWDPTKLVARINNCLKAPKQIETKDGLLRIGQITLDVVGHEVRRGDEKVSLTPLEFKLLSTLAGNPKKVFSREDLLKDVWDYPPQGDTRLVNVHIQRLRSKIEEDPDNPTIVVTVRGIGYKAGLN